MSTCPDGERLAEPAERCVHEDSPGCSTRASSRRPLDHQVEILSCVVDAGVPAISETATEQKRHTSLRQFSQYFPIELDWTALHAPMSGNWRTTPRPQVCAVTPREEGMRLAVFHPSGTHMADTPSAQGQTVRISATADLHFGRHPAETYAPILAMAAADADVLAICGDLTDHGRIEEAEALAKLLTQTVRIPIVAVLGNHDYESAQEGRVREILAGAGVHMLDGDAVEILGVGFAGVKGFCGGFGPRALGLRVKLIRTSCRKRSPKLKLETALARLRSVARVAAPRAGPSTVEGEPPEIYPFLGSTRLEEPLVRYEVSAVFHGHAHHGQPEGRTSNGAPVFNVSLPLMQRTRPEQPFGRFDVHVIEQVRS